MKEAKRRILVLEGTPMVFPARPRVGYAVTWAKDPFKAAKRLSESTFEFLVLNGDVAWHRTFAAGLPPERRPAILVFGGETAAVPAIGDEWVRAPADFSEILARLEIARERAHARRQNARRSFVDHLTGLPNRRAIVRALIRESRRVRRHGGPLSLALLDLDNFKRINDSYGHSAGDKLLRRVGLAFGNVTRANELCGRVGGDEFAIVVDGAWDEATSAVERAKEALAQVGVSASAGVAEWGQGEQLRELYRRADEALKANKNRKRSIIRAHERVGKPIIRESRVPWTQTELFDRSTERKVAIG